MRVKLLITAIFLCFGINSLPAQSISKSDNTEILLIGSSYFNSNNLKSLIQGLADGSGKDVYIEMCGQNGLYLADHASSISTEAKINERDWDYVILQGVGVLVAYPDHFIHHPVYPALQTLRDKIVANCQSTKMVFCLPWAFEDGMTWYQNWTDTYEDMQCHIYDTTLQYSDEIGFEIAPVGWAWYGILEANNYPLHYLHMSDWNHPSLKGSYLMACVIYTTIFQESTVNNPFIAGIPVYEATEFQTAATDTVLNNLELWNISPLLTVNNGSIRQNHFLQNMPNPFKTKTTISYSLEKEQRVNILIYDNNGNILADLVNKKQRPGDYEIEFDASGLAAGIYICHMIAGKHRSTALMIHYF